MKVWNAADEVKPSKSGIYRVKTDNRLITLKYAYYNSQEDRWIDDDGFWLPMDATPYVTNWAELKD
jgi:hypothetical protein